MMKNLSEIRSNFKGQVVGPEDTDYNKLRTVFYGGFDKKPAMIILAENSEDVSKAVILAKESGLELAIRSGGHSPAGHSVSNGVVIDLRNMKHFEINNEEKTAWIQPGLTAGEFTREVDKHDLALGFGDTGTVGIGGITAAGGIGYLVRNFGLAIDNLLAAEVVTADGKVLMADKDLNSDLFWAIRGGGGNFGVLTNLKFKLHDIGEVYGGMMILPATPEVISGFMTEANRAPNELSTILNIMPAFPMPGVPEEIHGTLIAMALIVYSGDSKNGEKVVAPFRALAAPIVDMLKPMRYPEIFFPEGEEYHPKAVTKTMFLKHVDLETAKIILENLNLIEAPMKVTQLRTLGGAVSKLSPDATAFAHRNSKILGNVAAFFENEEERLQREKWAEEFSQKLFQDDTGSYIGFLGNEGERGIHSAYPRKTCDRLQEIKKKYDPTNLFRLNQNIKPELK